MGLLNFPLNFKMFLYVLDSSLLSDRSCKYVLLASGGLLLLTNQF